MTPKSACTPPGTTLMAKQPHAGFVLHHPTTHNATSTAFPGMYGHSQSAPWNTHNQFVFPSPTGTVTFPTPPPLTSANPVCSTPPIHPLPAAHAGWWWCRLNLYCSVYIWTASIAVYVHKLSRRCALYSSLQIQWLGLKSHLLPTLPIHWLQLTLFSKQDNRCPKNLQLNLDSSILSFSHLSLYITHSTLTMLTIIYFSTSDLYRQQSFLCQCVCCVHACVCEHLLEI